MIYQRILAAVDGSDISKAAVQEAIRLASVLKSTLRIISVAEEYTGYVEGLPVDIDAYRQSIQDNARKILADMTAIANHAAITFETKLIEINVQDVVPEKIIEYANNWQAELIVIGTHGRRGFNRVMMGSVAESVARLSNVPVLLVHGQTA